MNPIFIVGAPRSGTSLLRNILNRHPSIALCDETYFFYYVHNRRRAFGDPSNTRARRLLVDRYLATHRIRRLGVNLNSLSQVLMKEGQSYSSFFNSFMRFYAKQNGKTRYGEKTPQHALYSETLCNWYPDCKILHILRDPRDVVASLLRMPWGSSSVLANGRAWLKCATAASRSNNRENYMLIRYEQLVSQPEKELQRICTFIGEEYRASMLDIDQKLKTDRWWFQRAHRTLTTKRVEQWVEQLHSDQVAILEWLLGKYMRQFGYQPSGRQASASKILISLADEFLDVILQRITKWPRIWYHWMEPTNLAAEEAWIDRNT